MAPAHGSPGGLHPRLREIAFDEHVAETPESSSKTQPGAPGPSRDFLYMDLTPGLRWPVYHYVDVCRVHRQYPTTVRPHDLRAAWRPWPGERNGLDQSGIKDYLMVGALALSLLDPKRAEIPPQSSLACTPPQQHL